MNWHKRLTQAREAKNIKKSALAKLVGVSAPTVTDWESGETKMIEGVNLIKVCDKLQVSPEWLMHGKGEIHDTNIAAEIKQEAPQYRVQWTTDYEAEVLSLCRSTDEDGRWQILNAAQSARQILFIDTDSHKP